MGSYTPTSRISRIAIIGAGPTGLAFAKYLLAENAFERIQIYEQRSRVGGIWNLSEPTRSKRIPVPQNDPTFGQRGRSWHLRGQSHANAEDVKNTDKSLEFESPLYDYLETNIPKPLMAYSDKPFSDDLPLFPGHEDVLRYIEEYAEDITHLIQFNTEVLTVNVDKTNLGLDEWTVATQNLCNDQQSTEKYDAVVVANGHYSVPSIPDICGIKQWNEAYPDSIIHSKAYRKPEDYTDKKVLVVGNSASGMDIAFQIGQQCRQPVLLSSRSVGALGMAKSASWRKDVTEVVEFLDPSAGRRSVQFADGEIESDIDRVVFATGYFYSFPFLRNIKPAIVSDGLRVERTYQHLFNIDHLSLVFPVVNLRVVPFPLAENQAAVVARVWSGSLSLPSADKMRLWEDNTAKVKGRGKYFHLLKFPEDAEQVNFLYDWAREASREEGSSERQGQMGMRWDEHAVWLRSQFPAIKAAYQQRGDDRTRVKTIGELGFDFDKWREFASDEDLKLFEHAKCW